MEVTEQNIERYVRQPEMLSLRERKAVEALLERDEAASALAEFFRVFYADFARLEDVTAPQVEGLLGKLFPPAPVIPLHPFRSSSAGGGRYTTVLAAMSTPSPRRFETLATLASEEEGLLVRILCDHTANTCRLYVLAGEPERQAHAVLSFPALGLDFVTDEHGRVDFSPSPGQLQADWSTVEAVFRPPIAACSISADEALGMEQTVELASGHKVRTSFEAGRLRLDVRSDDAAAPAITRAVLKQVRGCFLIPIKEGTGSLDLEALPAQFTLRLYA